MTLGPAPDWQQIAWMVGNYEGEPILVTVDGLGNITGGLGAYKDTLVYRKTANGDGGDKEIITGAVPANTRWVLQNIMAWHYDTNPLVVDVMIKGPTYYYFLFSDRFLMQYEPLHHCGQWILKEGDKLSVSFRSLGSGKAAWVNATGYKIETE